MLNVDEFFKKWFHSFAVVSLYFCISGCDGQTPVAEANNSDKASLMTVSEASIASEEARLKSRVLDRWGAIKDKDFAKAYEFMTPAYRKLYGLDVFVGKFGGVVVWDRIDIVSVTIKENSAKVLLNINYQLVLPTDTGLNDGQDAIFSKELEEIWLKTDEEWWFIEHSS